LTERASPALALQNREKISQMLIPSLSTFAYLCNTCRESRGIDELIDVFDPLTKLTLSKGLFELEDIEMATLLERCFFFTRFKETSDWHTVWLNYDQVSDSTKWLPFVRKVTKIFDGEETVELE